MRSSSGGGGTARWMIAPLGIWPAVGTPCDRGLRLAGDVEAGDGDGALRVGVDEAVGRRELGEQQRAAHQRARVAERGDGDVEARADVHAGGQVGGDDHRGDVAVGQRAAADVDAHAVEHRAERLLGERRAAQRVAGSRQADHQAVADQLAVARAAQGGDVLDADGGRGRADQRADEEGDEETPHQPPLTRTAPSGWTTPVTVTPLSSLRTLTEVARRAVLQRHADGGDRQAAVDIDQIDLGAVDDKARNVDPRRAESPSPAAACVAPSCRSPPSASRRTARRRAPCRPADRTACRL